MGKLGAWVLAFGMFMPNLSYGKTKECLELLSQEIPLVSQLTDFTCGVACVRSLTRYFLGTMYSEKKLAEWMDTYTYGYTRPERLERMLRTFHLKVHRETRQSLDDLRTYLHAGEAVILFVTIDNTSHYVLLRGLGEHRIELMDPWVARMGRYSSMTLEQFGRIWRFELEGMNYRHALLRVGG